MFTLQTDYENDLKMIDQTKNHVWKYYTHRKIPQKYRNL